MDMNVKMSKALDKCIEKIQKEARENSKEERPMWPMIIFRTPKG